MCDKIADMPYFKRQRLEHPDGVVLTNCAGIEGPVGAGLTIEAGYNHPLTVVERHSSDSLKFRMYMSVPTQWYHFMDYDAGKIDASFDNKTDDAFGGIMLGQYAAKGGSRTPRYCIMADMVMFIGEINANNHTSTSSFTLASGSLSDNWTTSTKVFNSTDKLFFIVDSRMKPKFGTGLDEDASMSPIAARAIFADSATARTGSIAGDTRHAYTLPISTRWRYAGSTTTGVGGVFEIQFASLVAWNYQLTTPAAAPVINVHAVVLDGLMYPLDRSALGGITLP